MAKGDINCTRDPYTGRLLVQAVFEEDYTKSRFEFFSDRNQSISKLTDISDLDPDKTPGEERYSKNINVWFPVVDIQMEPGMYGKARISGVDFCQINSYFCPEKCGIENGEAVFDLNQLSYWENGLFLPDKKAVVNSFAMVKESFAAPSISRRAFCEIRPLDEEWGGTVAVFYQTPDGQWKEHGSLTLTRQRDKTFDAVGVNDKEASLNLCLDYIIHSLNWAPANPYYGGLFLFYDCDADMYRNGQWPWSWGAAVKLLLECAKMADDPFAPVKIHRSSRELIETARRIGMTTLKFQIENRDHIADQFGTTRYTVRNFSDHGYEELVNTGSDTGFLCGWAWIPLYEATKDERFLEASKSYLNALERMIDDFELPPQEWLPEPAAWTGFTIDESGFGTEGISETYRVTQDKKYQELCRKYIQKHLDIFEREDGLWERQYNFRNKTVEPTVYMTRGMGWALEGLLAAHRCMPEGSVYLKKAIKMADCVIRYQNEDGSWGFHFNTPEDGCGTADKGTVLWSLLLFMLYRETGDERHRKAAEKALKWCMAHQYTGSNMHARGGIISPSGESGITYRGYFRLCCQYTSSFAGLALLQSCSGELNKK